MKAAGKGFNQSDSLEQLLALNWGEGRHARDLLDAFARAIGWLNSGQVEYAVVGRLALARYRAAQFTSAIELRIAASLDQELIAGALNREVESAKSESLAIWGPSSLRLVVSFVNDKLEAAHVRAAARTFWLGVPARVATPEYLIWLGCKSTALECGVDAIDAINSGHASLDRAAAMIGATGDLAMMERFLYAHAKAEIESRSSYSTSVERRMARLRA